MIYIVSWESKETGLPHCKRYSRKDAAQKLTEMLSCDCVLTTYTDYGEQISEVKIIKEQKNDQ